MNKVKLKALCLVAAQGENAWVFVKEENISESIKHFIKFEGDLFSEAKKTAPKGTGEQRLSSFQLLHDSSSRRAGNMQNACLGLSTCPHDLHFRDLAST